MTTSKYTVTKLSHISGGPDIHAVALAIYTIEAAIARAKSAIVRERERATASANADHARACAAAEHARAGGASEDEYYKAIAVADAERSAAITAANAEYARALAKHIANANAFRAAILN
jgi:hypothetical protein